MANRANRVSRAIAVSNIRAMMITPVQQVRLALAIARFDSGIRQQVMEQILSGPLEIRVGPEWLACL